MNIESLVADVVAYRVANMPELTCVRLEKGKFVSDVQTCVTILTLTGKNDHT